MAFSGSQTTALHPHGVMGIPYAFVAKTAAVVSDARTVVGRVMIAFTSPGDFRVRTQQTGGSDDLQTVSGGSAITIEVIA